MKLFKNYAEFHEYNNMLEKWIVFLAYCSWIVIFICCAYYFPVVFFFFIPIFFGSIGVVWIFPYLYMKLKNIGREWI